MHDQKGFHDVLHPFQGLLRHPMHTIPEVKLPRPSRIGAGCNVEHEVALVQIRSSKCGFLHLTTAEV